jgi:4'-phosphopantetheinyl transferase EntD
METGARPRRSGRFAAGQGLAFARLGTDAAYAEVFGNAPVSALMPPESAYVENAALQRHRDFAAVRHCARQAMQRLGVPAQPILPDAEGVPCWPPGLIGSMTHCDGYGAAVVARAGELLGLGLDAEPHRPLPDDVRNFVLDENESESLLALARAPRAALGPHRVLRQGGCLQGLVPARPAVARIR